MQIKPKHRKLVNHFYNFIDKHNYPNYNPTDESIKAFIKQQSYGPKSLYPEETLLIEPLMNGQTNKEITLKTMWQAMGDFWSTNSGWGNIILGDIDCWFKSRRKHKDRLFIKALIKIYRNCYQDGFLNCFLNYTGLTKEEKDKYIVKFLNNNK